jgi:hypothetical protein
MWSHGSVSTFRRISGKDETRISRRPQGGRELQEISNGAPSKAKDSYEPEETAEGDTERMDFPDSIVHERWKLPAKVRSELLPERQSHRAIAHEARTNLGAKTNNGTPANRFEPYAR